jgi:hypothetical protein
MKLNVLHEEDIALQPEPEVPATPAPLAPEPETDLGPKVGLAPSGYTLDNAKSQIDGILKKWMDLSGAYPEGEQRERFLEIGERLEEISNTLERDFMHEAESPL